MFGKLATALKNEHIAILDNDVFLSNKLNCEMDGREYAARQASQILGLFMYWTLGTLEDICWTQHL